jgi:RNase H-fold protein (predicted Holliday junction resolvase)
MAEASEGAGKRVVPAQLTSKVARQVFVAYPYRLYPRADYRRVFVELSEAFDVKFVFADEAISTLHVLDKIKNYITESEFGIYDIS